MALPHRSYPRIPLHAEAIAAGGEWTATEKIHGANFVVATDGKTVRFGKRKAWLEPTDPFFGWQLLRCQLEAAVLRLHAHLGAPRRVYVYGELFGGGYPHPAVPHVPGLAPVQTGTWYAPSLEFAAFDVFVEGDEDRFLAHDTVAEACGVAELSTVPLVARGSKSELFALPVRRETLIPARLGLPRIAGNIAEGLVLKPAASLPPALRPTMKRKIEEFDEARFDDARPFDPDAFLPLHEVLTICKALVNAARIASARSKVGEAVAAVRQEVILDVLVDLLNLLDEVCAAFDDEECDLRDGC